jgi:hypothetical protein
LIGLASMAGVSYPRTELPLASALAPGTNEKPYSVFEVTNRIVVQHGPAEPWFGEPGMGTQYYLPASVQDLLRSGYLRRGSLMITEELLFELRQRGGSEIGI